MTAHGSSSISRRHEPHPCVPGRAAPDLRDHLASRRRQDHADRAPAAARRRDPCRRPRQGARRGPARQIRLDEDRAGARHLRHQRGDDLRVRGRGVQPARHAGPRGFLGRHLPHAHRRRFRRDGDRRRQGHRDADPQAVRGLPAARHPDHDLRQQDGPRGARSARTAGRDLRPAPARMRPDGVAGRHGAELPRHDRSLYGAIRAVWRRRQNGRQCGGGAAVGRGKGQAGRGRRARPRRDAALRSRHLSRGPPDAGVLRLGAQEFRRARPVERAGQERAAARARAGARAARWSRRTPKSPASCSRSRPTWTPTTATASRSSGWPAANSAAA